MNYENKKKRNVSTFFEVNFKVNFKETLTHQNIPSVETKTYKNKKEKR